MLGRLREQYQSVMMPVGRALAKTGITPNVITGLTLLVAMVSTYFFAIGDLLIGLAVMILTVVMDMFDGAVARAANLGTKFGATFDHTLDRYAEFFFMLGLMLGPIGLVTIPWWPLSPGDAFIPWFWGFFALFGMIMASFARAKAESVGGMENCAVGFAERQEKLILTIAGILLLALPSSNIWMDFLNLLPIAILNFFVLIDITNILTVCIMIVGILSHITVAQRLLYARKMILSEGQDDTEDV
ncbi:MAG: CDP-alcohol phosphatidyltransferase family protein [Candidatus Thorarchaeota archaeon]|nr:CDP-alcohol phosphatidyltransferase family protein [Candidatus Thorarchaeota archaeon]MCK5238031.1 CDP-alcohol phosphatidyltransferase family protein [Candidatus Thorarchaeota archaeon]